MVLTKFESKSARVKGVAFHSTRPWVLASLHTGQIQLWDYRVCALIDRFEEHDGPVRGIDFHIQQPLFVSGGDDYKLKLWNISQRKCLFTLHGHLDYVRTTFFHREYPWILSASDDQTIRVWNWQSRSCICVMTGHNHYVMCAQFHPNEDLIISASLDQTVRIWDMSNLRKKNVYSTSSPLTSADGTHSTADLFGHADVVVRFVLEGHDRGVNWASFHPNLPFAVSAADDRFIKIWRMNESRAWEVDTLRGHFNNISCVLFAPGNDDLIISNGEDKCLKVWSFSKRTCLQTVRRDSDRFWVLAKHPSLQLFIAGHDAGFVLFKLNRERPAFCVHRNHLLYVKDRVLRRTDFAESKDVALATLSSVSDVAHPYSLDYNHNTKIALLVCRYPKDEQQHNHYYCLKVPSTPNEEIDDSVGKQRSKGSCATWISRSRFAVLSKDNLVIKSEDDSVVKTINLGRSFRELYAAFAGHVVLAEKDRVHLYDCQESRIVGSLKIRKVKHVHWSPSSQSVALLTKNNIYLSDREFVKCRNLFEDMCRIKSGVWYGEDLFLFTTANHMKYVLVHHEDDAGIVRSVDVPLYLTKVIEADNDQATVFCLDRSIVPRVFLVDLSECRLKLALVTHQYDRVMSVLAQNRLMGQAVISYLTKKNYPELAYQFVSDPKTKFALALQSGDLEQAHKIVAEIGGKAFWAKLLDVANDRMALRTVENCLKRLNADDKLGFLYTITGQSDRMAQMQKIAKVKGDKCEEFRLALLLGDVEARVRLLRSANQSSLAYVLAKTHGLDQIADEVAFDFEENVVPEMDGFKNPIALLPLTPIAPMTEDWPLLSISATKKAWATAVVGESVDLGGAASKWAETDEDEEDLEKSDEELAGWEADEDALADIPAVAVQNDLGLIVGEYEILATKPDLIQSPRLSPLLFLVINGQFKEAFEELNEQIGVKTRKPFVQVFADTYRLARLSISGAFPNPALVVSNLQRHFVVFEDLRDLDLKQAYSQTTEGKFVEAIATLRNILVRVPLIFATDSSINDELVVLLETCRQYILGLEIELSRRILAKQPNADSRRLCELALYFSHCRLQRVHNILTLRGALNACYKHEYYRTAALCAQRLLELGPPSDLAQKARSLLSVCEQKPISHNEQQLKYDPLNPFEICSASYLPIYRNNPSVDCPFCAAVYLPEFAGSVCAICKVAEIGKETKGLRLFVDEKRRSRNTLKKDRV